MGIMRWPRGSHANHVIVAGDSCANQVHIFPLSHMNAEGAIAGVAVAAATLLPHQEEAVPHLRGLSLWQRQEVPQCCSLWPRPVSYEGASFTAAARPPPYRRMGSQSKYVLKELT